MSNRCPINVEVLVVDRKLLRYSLLLGVDIMKRLGGVYVRDQQWHYEFSLT